MIYQWALGPAIWVIPALVVVVFGVRYWRLRRRALPEFEDSPGELLIDDSSEKARRAGFIALGALGFLLLISPALAFVPAGHRGVVYDLAGGVQPGERPEGLTVVIPWWQHVNMVDVRTQVYENAEFYAQSSDLQEISVPIAVNYRIDPKQAAELYQRVGPRYTTTVVRPAIDQWGKEAIGQVTAEDFPQHRGDLALDMVKGISNQLAEYGIIVEYANVADAIFDKEFLAAVRGKVIAEQNVAEAERRVQEEEFRKQQEIKKAEATRAASILEAEGVAEANRMIARSLNPAILTYLRLISWDGRLPQTLIGEGAALDAIVQLPEDAPRSVPEDEQDSDPYSVGGSEPEGDTQG